ncbi:alpha-amylase family glycosyl hydrolase [Rubellicoccus peritrichatus]|uniref:Alpha-amylase family glycosyl hydrolase n=1 Tax=Rubellicoccus peritrichatus TaxID=3080537 RepID=A0AAQ3L6R2_9BACT|nr:alpha-amylase family glycosyl hydrolase [Puniceicoccus sp. CR14]WOO40574.1 alpha-amylase family glycosyl hydrolase [Puniceicoccus sp. CR14]
MKTALCPRTHLLFCFFYITTLFTSQVYGEWFFRGTPNNWDATQMTMLDANNYEIIQEFNGEEGNARFKIDRNGDWAESYPSQDYIIEDFKTYRINFNTISKEITVREFNDKWYFRGTPNAWNTAEMTHVGGDTYEYTATFNGQESPARFLIDHFGDFSERYPATDFHVTDFKTYKITFNAATKAITADEVWTPDTWYFRGTPNAWNTAEMTRVSANTYEYVATFNGEESPARFLIDHFGDFSERYPAVNDQLVTDDRIYKITFNSDTKAITTEEIGVIEPWYFRGTPNNWNTAAMTHTGNGFYEYTATFNGEESPARFLIDRYGDFSERYPIPDYEVTDNKTYRIIFDVVTKDITVTELGATSGDFREETIYFVMTTRFYDGDSANNMKCWDGSLNPNTDPAWRGDFKGLIEKLDYIKALGFSAIWITPVVKNASGYDYHGYHAIDHTKVDFRYESPGVTYQTLIDEVHARGMKIIQDIVLNHSCNFGEENLYPMFTRSETISFNEDPDVAMTINDVMGVLPNDYLTLVPNAQFGARIDAMKEDFNDTEFIYHHEKSLQWEGYTVQTAQIAGDTVDLNTENPTTAQYLIDAYNGFIDMGVDAFRVDTVKHISRLSFNNYYLPAFKARGGSDFFIFGEIASRYRQVWNSGIPAISTPFYTWAETQSYPWGTRVENEASTFQHWQDNDTVDNEPTSNNHLLFGNDYHAPDHSLNSGMAQIDFPMHWNFQYANDAFNVALGGDQWYNDATYNVTYVDSHDYAPDGAPENQRFAQPQDSWAENLSLMFTFRGIPCLYYGSEIEFKKGHVIDVGPNAPLENTGRAYFGSHIEGSINVTDFGEYSNVTGEMANTLNHPLAQHIRRLNLIRRAIPALQKGQYSTEGVSGSMAFKRRFTDGSTDSFALIAVSSGATFNGIPNGTYVDAITGDVQNVGGGSLTANVNGKGNLKVYVLNGPGKIGVDGTYLKP